MRADGVPRPSNTSQGSETSRNGSIKIFEPEHCNKRAAMLLDRYTNIV